jgi:pyruvate/2-oxoglutarate/acetoin dehydrogenase E1 component
MSNPTMKAALRDTIDAIMEEDPSVFVIGEDVALMGGAFGVTAGLLDKYGPDRVRDAPISETAILGAAIGAAMVGMRPIVEIQFIDFIFVALDQLLHQAITAHYASGGHNPVPMVIRANYAAIPGIGPQDTATLYGALMQFPGLTVLIPSSAAEAASLLRQAVKDPNPVLLLEPRQLYGVADIAPAPEALPMTRARIVRLGKDLTVTAVGGMLRTALATAEKLAADGLDIEVVDLRCVMPLDEAAIRASVGRTGGILALDEAPRGGGLAAEVLAVASEAGRKTILRRLTAKPHPIAYARHLGAEAVPGTAAIEAAMREAVAAVKS